MTRHPFTAPAGIRRRLATGALAAAVSLLAAPSPAAAQDKSRSACTLHAASGDVPSDRADGLSAEVTGAKPVGLANWDVRWWQRHRLWITIAATNRGDGATSVLPEVVVDLHRDGSLARSLVGDPLVLGPHAAATTHMALYVPDDARTVGVRLHAPAATAAATDVGAALSVECSASRFDIGEMAKPAATLLDEALTLYITDVAEPLPDARKAFDDERQLASGAQDASDIAWAMRGLMGANGDDVSTMRPAGAPPAPAETQGTQPPQVDVRGDGTAVLRLLATRFQSDAQRLAWAQDLRDRIAAAARTRPRAWIVDLREHAGDDMWPSLAGLSQLLEGPVVGAFVTRAGKQEWVVERGAARVAGGPAMVDLQLPPEPAFAGPVAVLLGAHTTNVGEAVAVAFEGRPHTRFFGAPTRGQPALTGHARILSDGSVLTLLDTRFADRNGLVYRGPIEPDETIDASVHTGALPQQAVDWVLDEHLKATTGR